MGWASGMQAGLQAGQAFVEGMERRALADESKRYEVSEGAYGQGLQANIDQVRALQAQNPEQAAQYDPAIAELTRRQGLTSADYSVGGGWANNGVNYATREAAQAAARPLRTEGFARVYREHGNVAKSAELDTQAQQHRAAEQQYKLGGLHVKAAEALGRETEEKEANKLRVKADWNTILRTQDPDTGEYFNRVATKDDELRMAQMTAGRHYAAGNADSGNLAAKEFRQLSRDLITDKTAERVRDGNAAIAAAKLGNHSLLIKYYKDHIPDGALVKNIVESGGKLHISRTDMSGNPVSSTSQSLEDIIKTISSFDDPAKAIKWAHDNSVLNESMRHHKALEAGAAEGRGIQRQHLADQKAYQSGMLANSGGRTLGVVDGAYGATSNNTGEFTPFKKGFVPSGDTTKDLERQRREFSDLSKTDNYLQAERRGDSATMRGLIIGRGLDPANFGMGGGAPDLPAAKSKLPNVPAPTPKVGLQTTPTAAHNPYAGMTPEQIRVARLQGGPNNVGNYLANSNWNPNYHELYAAEDN